MKRIEPEAAHMCLWPTPCAFKIRGFKSGKNAFIVALACGQHMVKRVVSAWCAVTFDRFESAEFWFASSVKLAEY